MSSEAQKNSDIVEGEMEKLIGVPRGRVRVFKHPPEIPKAPPKSCQTQPNCENC